MQQGETFKLSRVILTSLLVALIAIPLVLAYKYKEILAVVLSDKTETEQLIAEAVSPVADRKAYISCEPISQSGNSNTTLTRGETPFIGRWATPVILLTEETCLSIDTFSNLTSKTDATTEQLQALITISHEAFHTTGVIQEDVAECYAVQRISDISRKLGATIEEAEQVQDRAVSLQRRTASDEYITSECRDNGPYDLDPARAGSFPY